MEWYQEITQKDLQNFIDGKNSSSQPLHWLKVFHLSFMNAWKDNMPYTTLGSTGNFRKVAVAYHLTDLNAQKLKSLGQLYQMLQLYRYPEDIQRGVLSKFAIFIEEPDVREYVVSAVINPDTTIPESVETKFQEYMKENPLSGTAAYKRLWRKKKYEPKDPEYYKKYREEHREQERRRALAYYYAHKKEISEKLKQKRLEQKRLAYGG